MRHFGSLLVAAVFAPSIFLLTGTGLSAFNSALDDNKVYDPLGSLAALGALLLAGVLYAILVMARLSPLGPGLAGLAAWGISGWALWDIQSYQEFFSRLDVHMGGAVGELGLGIMLGIPLVATLFSGRRWRRNDLYPSPEPLGRSPADPAWLLPATPLYQATPVPDIPAPTLRYPASAAFPTPEPTSSWRTPPYIPPIPDPPAAAQFEPETTDLQAPTGSDSPPASSAAPRFTPLASFAAATRPAPSDLPPAARPISAPSEPAQVDSATLDEISLALRPTSGPPAQITLAPQSETPPLPRRVPAPPPGGRGADAPIVAPPPDNEETERLGPPGSIVPQGKPIGSGDANES